MAAKLDLEIDEGATWIMSIDFWENTDKTIPVDISNQEFKGAFSIGTQYIEMNFITTDNSLECTTEFAALENLSSVQGAYDIQARDTGTNEKFRILEGAIRVNREVTTT